MSIEKYNYKNNLRLNSILKNKFRKKIKTGFFLVLLVTNQSNFAGKGIVVSTAKEPIKRENTDLNLIRGWSAIGTGPYFGLGASYDGSDLVALQPNIHKDLGLLKQHAFIAKTTGDELVPRSPYVQFSGITEVQLVMQNKAQNSVDITTANLDIDAWVNPWLTAYANFGIETDESKNGRFRMIQAFATLGNLDKSPFYGSLGQMYVPFGSFSTGTSDMGSVTRSLGRIYERALSAGYYPGTGWHLIGAVYNGRTRNSNVRNLDQFATSAIHEGKINLWNLPATYKAGLSYTNNIAESAVLREVFINGTKLHRFVPAGDAFMQLRVTPWVLRLEYVTAFRHFSARDIQQKGRQIQPRSLLTELGYDFHVFGKPSWMTLHHSQVNDAAAASPVNHQIGLNTSINILKNTLLSFELSHRRHYASRDFISNNDKGPDATPDAPLNTTAVTEVNNSFNNANRNILVITLDIFY